MKERTLGKSEFKVSEIGLGCWQFGGDWGNGMNQEKATKILAQAVECGITFFDTADVYGDGQSESFIGNFLENTNNNNIRVATKFGRGKSVFPDNYSEKALRESVEASINRLKTDHIDLLQLHCVPTEVLRNGEIFTWLRTLKAEGLIKNFGASVESVEEGLICLNQEGLSSLQVIFNIFRQKLVDELLPQAKNKGVGIIVRLPLASGLLTGKFSKSYQFAQNDHRNYNRNGEVFNVGETFAGLPFEKGVDLSEQLKQQFCPSEISMTQLALRWILDHDAVSTVIPGASSPNHGISNASSSTLSPLSKELIESLRTFYFKNVHSNIRGVY